MKKNQLFPYILVAAVSMGFGAGTMYLHKKKQIEFADRYPLMLDIEKFMCETAEVGLPENVTDEQVINAFLSLYGDKYTYYKEVDLTTKESVVAEVNSSPTALGCGFEIDFNEEDEMFFSVVKEDMPASRQGIKEMDKVISIDDVPVTEYAIAREIRGKQGTTVKLVIERDGVQRTIVFQRYSDSHKAIKIENKMIGSVLYIDYNRIGDSTASTIMGILEDNEFNSVVFDLRENPGGEISIAVNLADLFIQKADVTLHYKNGNKTVQSTTDKITYDVPIVLLVNEKTASSAEIFTALLRQYSETTIVGTTTFGKGLFQSYAVFNGSMLQYTAGYTTVGDWECWQGKGIAPDIEVEMDSSLIGTDEDIQLQKALEVLENELG
ncbi:MAG: S41 family peptidase [Ruminococcus sp.]